MRRRLLATLFAGSFVQLSALFTAMLLLPPDAAGRQERPAPEEPPALACRIVSIRSGGSLRTIHPQVDVSLDPATGTTADQSFETVMPDGRTLGAKVQRVRSALPRERYNVTLLVDGRTHMRINHMDLDIYIETTIEGRVYALHCFPEAESRKGTPGRP